MLRTCLLSVLIFAVCKSGSAQECPTDWTLHDGMCYFFSEVSTKLQYFGAESFCQQNNGHLVSFLTVDERDWVTRRWILGPRPQTYWIGLDDTQQEGNFRWIDGNELSDDVKNFAVGEPNNIDVEHCVEVQIRADPRLAPIDAKWNDLSCQLERPFACKRPTGSVEQCPDGWSLQNGRCYQVMTMSTQWYDADQECKNQGADLVAISDATEEQIVENLVRSAPSALYWIGLSDTATPGTYGWSDTVTTYSYNNWATGQPPATQPYRGSTCASINYNLGYKWDTGKCSDERYFVCERGLRANCPYSWLYADGKCFELVVNPSRVGTWTEANRACQAVGAGLLKIETDAQQRFIATSLESYLTQGQREIWMGISDIGHDDTLLYWDKSSISINYWDDGMPATVTGRDDCGNLYTGGNGNNWEVTSCFLQLGYICELPEGKSLSTGNSITLEGKCEEGWHHYDKKCYYFSELEQNQASAQTQCRGYSAELTSILDESEQSFIVGNVQARSWIGLQIQGAGLSWTDGSTVSFQNPGAFSNPSGYSCAVCNELGLWYPESCNTMRTFMCKKDEIPTDPRTVAPPTYVPDQEKCGGNGWISDPQSENCYKVFTIRRSWLDARTQCQLESGDLASVNYPNEQVFLETMVKGVVSASSLWLGGNDFHNSILTDQGWRWADGSPFNYVHWNSGEPNNQGDEDCMEIRTGDGLWNDLDCANVRGFICQKLGNGQDSIPGDVADDNCGSNDACCFKHIGCEYRGVIPDSSFSASTEKDQWFVASRGRLNTPADVIILSIPNEIYVGTGHGAWEPSDSDPDPWLQVDLPTHYELKGIITQGRNGLLKHEEMQWTTTYKVSYSQDASDSTSWQFILDPETGEPMVFDGNFDQNTMVTNFFPRPIVARHMRCHPMDYRDRKAMRLEYIGCRASCLHKIGMNSGYIPDDKITASSGNDAKQARPPVDPEQCLANSGDNGANYRGWIARTKSGLHCQPWNSQTPHPHQMTAQNYPDAGLVGDYCRNPDGRSKPWCYTLDSTVESEECDIPICPTYTPQGWQPQSSSQSEWIQVQFDTHYKVSGITLYNPSNSARYVQEYVLSFSDSGVNFLPYVNADNTQHIFKGLKSGVTSYMDVLSEPIATVYLRLTPTSWFNNQVGTIQFEVNGCYVDGVITCSELGTNFLGQDTYVVQCPPGCLKDTIFSPVYGTDIYTTHSAICPAAIHAGKANDNIGATVFVTNREGQGSYTGSYRNGITSDPFGAYTASMSFTGYSLRCDTGWYPWNEHCYWYSPKGDVKTWQSARATCISMGGDLVSILSSGENDFVESLLVKMENPGDDAWIGMTDLETQDYYLWADGSVVTFTKWFFREPNEQKEHCVQMYIIDGYWNDRECDALESYICKRPKTFLPPVTTLMPPTEAGCEQGWVAYGPSCYRVSDNELIQQYAVIHCQDMGSRLVSIHDQYEQSFVHALVTSSLPAFSGYTSWIGFTAHTDEQGGQYFDWQGSEESVTYTNWDHDEPEAILECSFPFVYRGVTYYDCTTADNPLALNDASWCSIDPNFSGRLIYCGNDNPQGCTYMDDQTGYWNLELCIHIRYYVCEKDRIGYTQPVETTVDPRFKCADGWLGNENTADCYQINDRVNRSERLTWQQANDYCQAQKADLVSIHSSNEEAAIFDFVIQNGVQSGTSFWLGLSEINIDAGYTWSDGTPVSYTNWANDEPNNHNGKENCVESYLIDQSAWNDLNCDAPRNWVCKISKRRTPSPPPTMPPPQGQETTECGSDTTWIKYTAPDGIARCYHFETDQLHGWGSAENECKKYGGHMVSVHSIEEKTFLLSRIAKSGKDNFWIGLRDVAERQFMWTDDSPLNYVNWGPGEPNDYLESEGCAEMGAHDGNWNDDNCGIQQSYICMKNIGDTSVTLKPTAIPEGNCPAGYSRYGNKCWMIGGVESNERLTWYDARERCENMSSTLAVIENEYEQAYISSLMYYVGRNSWIGMWGSMYAPYVWIDQSVVQYTNWGTGQPDYYETSCVRMDYVSKTVGKWNDDDCNGKNAFICFKRVSTDNPEPEPTVPPENCPDGYKLYGTACFKVKTTTSSWQAARQSCQQDGGGVDLASVNSGYENSMLKSMFWRDISADKVWIGMTFKTVTSTPGTPVGATTPAPVLTQTVFSWSDGWPVEYTSWGIGEPNTDEVSADSGCVYMNKDGGWTATATCTNAFAFVCKKSLVPIPTPPPTPAPLEGNCDPGFIGYGSYCYFIEVGIYTVETRSFWEARSECESRGAELASFHSESECIAITDMIPGSSHNLWIGLTHDGFSGWRWIDETAVDYFNWVPGEPNGVDRGEVCVEMYPWSGQWNDVDCFQGRGYICRMHKQYAYCGAVPLQLRQDCGYIGIEESVCLRRGCCWDELVVNANFSGCFYPENYNFGTQEPIGSPALSGGAIAGIVIGILLLIAIVGAGFYFGRNGNPFKAQPKSSNAAFSSSSQQAAGFDNPVHTMGGSSSTA